LSVSSTINSLPHNHLSIFVFPFSVPPPHSSLSHLLISNKKPKSSKKAPVTLPIHRGIPGACFLECHLDIQ
jgi:hypothetical protein